MTASATRTPRSVNVDEDALARFHEIYPMHGAFTWFVNEALRHFVSLHEFTPSDMTAFAVSDALDSSSPED